MNGFQRAILHAREHVIKFFKVLYINYSSAALCERKQATFCEPFIFSAPLAV